MSDDFARFVQGEAQRMESSDRLAMEMGDMLCDLVKRVTELEASMNVVMLKLAVEARREYEKAEE